ncbi:hypothetical protein EYF80_045706 [Liparis tanakae]|uniref:Uncharacterized protein n=1 Tax=Liparis tanakae TaxID=230148 RepID=A0A4Z2FT80_9TELE|nr:hypothetical protein EYF80_045706 [Liparis tanakae]
MDFPEYDRGRELRTPSVGEDDKKAAAKQQQQQQQQQLCGVTDDPRGRGTPDKCPPQGSTTLLWMLHAATLILDFICLECRRNMHQCYLSS